MDRETSVKDMVFEYTGEGCSVPDDVISVEFIEGLQKIEDDAFNSCKSLESVKLPSTVVEIGKRAFNYCSNLREVIFNDGLQKIGVLAFYNCKSQLRSVIMHFVVVEIWGRLQ